MKNLNDVKLGTRIYSGFIILLALLVLAGGVGWWGISHISKEIHDLLNGTNKMMAISARVRSDSIALRQYEKDIFININNPVKVEEYQKNGQIPVII